MKRHIWKINNITEKAYQLSKKYNILPSTAQILLNRKVEDFSNFLYGNLDKLYSPQLLPDLEKATRRIKQAIKEGERILVVGDYDVDGVMSLAIFYEFAKNYHQNFSFYIPDRIKEGYGLQKELIEHAKENKYSLILSFDCGTNCFSEIELAKKYKIDVIVIDHHQPKENLNNQFAFINPKRKDSSYPFSDLSSAGLSFKLLQALTEKSCYDLLDLVALSVVCDIVPLKDENRIFVKEGIKQLRVSDRVAIKYLCNVSSLKQENIDEFSIGYILGPRINASGRVATAKASLEIFLTEDKSKALSLAEKLSEYNQIRKDIELEILKEAESIVEKELINDYAIVLNKDGWHPGVLGIVASKLVDKYYRPSFVFSFDGQVGRGSARSIHSLHLVEALNKCSQFLELYGGHKKAAGMTILRSNFKFFKDAINTLVKENLKTSDLVPTLEIDMPLSFKDITPKLKEEIKMLEPFGEENPRPTFVTFAVNKKNIIKNSKNNFSLWITNDDLTYEAIFNNQDFFDLVNFGRSFDIVYWLDWNNYFDVPRLIIRDIRLADSRNKL